MHLEDVFIDIAQNCGEKCVVLTDRGVMDGSAYVSENIWFAILDETGWTNVQLRDKRYDQVVHLVTAADGAEEFYSLDNEARYETKEQAREMDQKLQNSWKGHPHQTIIQNKNDGFSGKMKRTVGSILNMIGNPVAHDYYKKYLLKKDVNGNFIFDSSIKAARFVVEETLLEIHEEGVFQNKVRQRGQGDRLSQVLERYV